MAHIMPGASTAPGVFKSRLHRVAPPAGHPAPFSPDEWLYQNEIFSYVYNSNLKGGGYLSMTGMHMGVQYNGIVYCNIHPTGLPKQAWRDDFVSTGGKDWWIDPRLPKTLY